MKFNNTNVTGLDTAIRSMRMPLQSFDKADSMWDADEFKIGEKDLDLAHRLLIGNDADSKFLRSVQVYVEITAPAYFTNELSTYKIGTVSNSSSLQHKGASRDFTSNDFETDPMYPRDIKIMQETWGKLIETINLLRQMYKETNDYHYFRLMRQLMPQSYLYNVAWTTNYQTLRTIWKQRIKQPHRLKEWTSDMAAWIDTLPYADDLIKYERGQKND